MGQKKLKRFAEILTFPNVLQYPENIQGQWHAFFHNDNQIILELACGKGEYSVGLGRKFPDTNFIGVDIKGNRLWVGAKIALQDKLTNVAFLRTHIDKITDYFESREVSEIWLPFPDPQLRTSRAKKRLTHPRYLRLYQQIMVPGGRLHLKTDSPSLYRFTKTVIELYGLSIIEDIPQVDETNSNELLEIKTHYEQLDIAQSRRIHYLQFVLPAEPLPERDEELKEILREEESERGS